MVAECEYHKSSINSFADCMVKPPIYNIIGGFWGTSAKLFFKVSLLGLSFSLYDVNAL